MSEPITTKFTAEESQILAAMLEDYRHILARRVCNDLWLKITHENKRIVTDARRIHYQEDYSDDQLVKYLLARIDTGL